MKNRKDTLGSRIKTLREQNKLSQQQLADSLIVSNKTVSKWEMNGSEPDTDTLIKLAELFNVTLDYLLKGETNIKAVVSISKMELACREDNIALLVGIDIDAFDETGKDLEYYAKEYNAKKILDYIHNIKLNKNIEKYEETHKNDDPIYYICALEEGISGEENLRLVVANVNREKIPNVCLELEKDGYHNFKVFTSFKEEDKNYNSLDYQYLTMNVLNDYGEKTLFISFNFLNDGESAIVDVTFFRKEERDRRKFFVNKEIMTNFINTLNEVDFKNWKSKNWGMPIYYVCYFNKGEINNDEYMPVFFYTNPPKEQYQKFIKSLMTLFFSVMRPREYRRFAIYFNDSCIPYYRARMKLEESKKIFKEIENERTIPGRVFE